MTAGNDFTPKTQDENAQTLADYLPDGFVFLAKNLGTSKLRQMLLGLGAELVRADQFVEILVDDYYISQTTQLIEEWERALGIPDSCFNNTGTIEQRRENVIIKLAKLNVATREDFIKLAALLGFTVEISGGAVWGIFPLHFPAIFFPSAKAARFTMVVDFDKALGGETFPYTFPVPFGFGGNNIVMCLFRKLKPAMVKIVFRFVL